MGKQRPIDLSGFDEIVKTTKSKELDLSAFDEVVKKKEVLQPGTPIGTQPSKGGFETFQTPVDTKIPSFLTQKGKVGYEQEIQKQAQQRQKLSEQLKSAQGAFRAVQGEALTEEIASRPDVSQGQIVQAEKESFKNIAPFVSELQNVTASIYKIPRYIYNVFAIPQNLAADALNVPELKADYDTVSKGTYNPLGVLDRVGDYSLGKAAEWEQRQRIYDKSITDQLIGVDGKDRDWARAGLQIYDNIIASVPSIASMYLSGGVANAAKMGSISKTLTTALPFASSQNIALEENKNIPDWLKPVNAAANALSEVIFEERFGTKAILDGLTEVAKTQGRDIAEKSAKDFVYNYIKKVLSKVQPVTDVVANSTEEMATRMSQNIIAKITGEDPNRNIMDGVPDAGIVGGAQGAGASAIRKGLDVISNKKSKAKVEELSKKREDLVNDLENSDLPNSVKEQIESKLEDINVEINDVLDSNRTEIENLPEGAKAEVADLSDRVESIKESLQNENISDTTRALLEEDLKTAEAELDAKFTVPQPTFDTEESIGEEIRESNRKFQADEIDQATWEQEQKDLNKRAEDIIPVPEEAEIGKPEEVVSEEKGEKMADVFHGGSVKDIQIASIDNPLYVSESESQSAAYAKGNQGKVAKFKVDKSKIANEEEVRDVINELGLKPQDESWSVDELNIYELIDPTFDTAMSSESINKLFRELEKRGYGGAEFLGMNIETLKNDINDIVIFNPKLATNVEQTKPTEETTVDALKDVDSTAKALEVIDNETEDLSTAIDVVEGSIKNSALRKSKQRDSLIPIIKKLSEEGLYAGQSFSGQTTEGKTKSISKLLSETYHQAKSDGSNPELVEAVEDLLKPTQDAIQEQTAGQVPVQPEAPVSKEVEQGKPEAKPKVVTEEGVKAEEVDEKYRKITELIPVSQTIDGVKIHEIKTTKEIADILGISTNSAYSYLMSLGDDKASRYGYLVRGNWQPIEGGSNPKAQSVGWQISSPEVKIKNITKVDDLKDVESTAKAFTAEGGNKVVDEKGEPITVYHTTTAENIQEFRTSGEIETLGGKVKNEGAYFTPNKGEYANKGGNEYAVQISIKNPYITTDQKESAIISPEKKAELVSKGHDGVILMRNGKPAEYIVFDKSQIKSESLPTQEQTSAQKVEQLRAEEQAELKAAIPNADQYLTDGKVDRTKITDAKDLKKFDEIYDKYDKLITPLLPEKETTAPKQEAPAKAAPLPKAKVATRLAFKKAVDLFYDISGTEGSAKKRTLAAKRKVFLEQNPSIKYIDDNWKDISKQLEAKGLITKKGNCP
jgi:hypothetical protein